MSKGTNTNSPPIASDDKSAEQLTYTLGRRIYKYNTINPSDVFGLKMKEGGSFDGSLPFHYESEGSEVMKVLMMSSHTSAADLLPLLISRFCFGRRQSLDELSLNFSSSENYITMITKRSEERKLMNEEHPLQLALDVVEHTSENPKFIFHSSISCKKITDNSSPEKHSGKASGYPSESDLLHSAQLKLESVGETGSQTSLTSNGSATTSKRSVFSKKSFFRRSPLMSRRAKSAVPTEGKSSQLLDSSFDSKAHKQHRSSVVGSLFSHRRKHPARTGQDGKGSFSSDEHNPPSPQLRSLLSPQPKYKKLPVSVLLPIYSPSTIVATGQVYKSVLVPRDALTGEVIRQALDRYGITEKPGKYILADTIGIDVPSPGNPTGERNDFVFKRLYTRSIHKDERPVIINEYWTPAEKCIRRFELMSKEHLSQLLLSQQEEIEVSTPSLRPRGVSLANQLLLFDKLSSSSSTDLELTGSKSEDEILANHRALEGQLTPQKQFSSMESFPGNTSKSAVENAKSLNKSRDSSPYLGSKFSSSSGKRGSSIKSGLYMAPQGSPYLMNLQPSSSKPDHVLFQLGPQVTEIGIFLKEKTPSSSTTEDESTVIHLHSLANTFSKVESCTVCRIHGPQCGSDQSSILEIPALESEDLDISCTLNGHTLLEEESCELHNFDILQIGKVSTLMYMDPTVSGMGELQRWNLQPVTALQTSKMKKRLSSQSFNFDNSDEISLSFSEMQNVIWHSVEELEEEQEKHLSSHKLSPRNASLDSLVDRTDSGSSLIVQHAGYWIIDLSKIGEHQLLEYVAQRINPKSLTNKLAVAYQVCMAVLYHQLHSNQDKMAALIEEILAVLKKCIMDSCEKLLEWQPDPHLMLSVLETLHPFIGVALFWLSNTLSVSCFLKQPVNKCVLTEDKHSSFVKVIQYALQQLLQIITKVLDGVLLSILEASASTDLSDDPSHSTNQLLDFLQMLLYGCEDYSVTSSVVQQFFDTIFYYINGASMHLLLEEGERMGAYNQITAVHLKESLLMLESWAAGIGLQNRAYEYLTPYHSVLDLLSTEVDTLEKMTWEEIALKCPRVKKAKINFFLSNYIVSNSSPYWEKPINWEPNLDDLGEVLDPEMLKVDFSQLPSVDLPEASSTIDLTVPPPDIDEITRLLSAISLLKNKEVHSRRRDSPCCDSGLDSPARSGDSVRSPPPLSTPCIYVHSPSAELKEEVGQEVLVESSSISEEQPPPAVQLIGGASPAEDQKVKQLTISRGSKDFGFSLQIDSDPLTDQLGISIAGIYPGSLSDENDDLLQLQVGDRLVKIDGIEFGMDIDKMKQYLKDAEDEVTITIAKKGESL